MKFLTWRGIKNAFQGILFSRQQKRYEKNEPEKREKGTSTQDLKKPSYLSKIKTNPQTIHRKNTLFYNHLHPNNINHLHDAICIKKLGKGTFGCVKLYQCKEKGIGSNITCDECFAVKELKCTRVTIEKVKKILINEYTIGSLLHHPSVIETLDIDIDYNSIIFEYCPGIDLFELIMKNKPNHKLYIKDYLYYFSQLLDAVEYIHSEHVAHLDIKLENIMIDISKKKLKLIDFGQSCMCSMDTTLRGLRGTEAYVPPEEYNLTEFIPFNVDIWALGIILYEIIYESIPWQNTSCNCIRFEHFKKTFNSGVLLPYIFKDVIYSDIFNKFFKLALNPNPIFRANIKELKSEFLSKVNIIERLDIT
jgi:serine/threonine protein kinase